MVKLIVILCRLTVPFLNLCKEYLNMVTFILTATLLIVHLCGLLHLHGSLYLHVTLFTPI